MAWPAHAPDNPVIRNMERAGYPDGKEPPYPVCPVCGQECSEIYKDASLDIIGCDNCVSEISMEDEPIPFVCPACREDAITVYKDRDGKICGCEECARIRNAWDEPGCFET